uniref:NEK3 n=1 Tax=Arundo donax TaxID=35708 RepID=A0A0A9BK17_ARUDO
MIPSQSAPTPRTVPFSDAPDSEISLKSSSNLG